MPNNWRPYAAKTHALEKKYTPAIIRLITKFRKEFIARYKENPSSARVLLQQHSLNEDLAKLVDSIYRNAGLLGAKILWAEQQKFLTQKDLHQIRKTKASGFGRNETWIRDVIEYLKRHMLKMVQSITENMREDILKILEKSIEEGWGIAETVRQLQTKYVLPRATLIARTEINNAANAGHKIAAESLPYEVDKGWVAAEDPRTRPGHKDMNKHWVGEDDFFNVPIYEGNKKVGYEEMEGPGDPNASAGNVVNCRCRRIYRPKRNEDGSLKLRRPNQARIIPMRRPQQLPNEQIAAILKSNIFISVK